MLWEITRFFHRKAEIPGTFFEVKAGGKMATTRQGLKATTVIARVTMCSAHIQSENFPFHWLEMRHSTSICDGTHHSMSCTQ